MNGGVWVGERHDIMGFVMLVLEVGRCISVFLVFLERDVVQMSRALIIIPWLRGVRRGKEDVHYLLFSFFVSSSYCFLLGDF